MANIRPEHRRGTTGAKYRALKGWLNATTDICWICGGRVDFTVHPRHPKAPSLDHAEPLSLGGDLLDPDNARQAHYGFNSSRGNGIKTKQSNARRVGYDW